MPAFHGLRILLLAGMGLGAMYMLHLLAQDYNKIRQPIRAITKALLRNKRQAQSGEIMITTNFTGNEINWQRILKQDPLNCLQSLICQIVSDTEIKTEEAEVLKTFVKFSYKSLPNEIVSAYNQGLVLKNRKMCFDSYPLCLYSAETMLTVLKWFISDA